MEAFEQHHEITSSYCSEIKTYDYEIKKELLYSSYSDTYSSPETLKSSEEAKEYDVFAEGKGYRPNIEDPTSPVNNQHFSTPFSVKDILNHNQLANCQFDRMDPWRTTDGKRIYEYESQAMYHQAPTHTEYYSQMYPNSLPVHPNISEQYWPQDMYYDPKLDYYPASYNYCHNLYHQSYEQYPSIPVHPPGVGDMTTAKPDVVRADVVPTVADKRTVADKAVTMPVNALCPPIPSSGSFDSSPRKLTRKFTVFLSFNAKHDPVYKAHSS